ncbi:MAG: hypothetical protein P4L42_11350 [Desulfocapsaceae bacterium]|nr:hypothetical protein [Desulfocapsaceae bacterium]
MIDLIHTILRESWEILLDSSVYILFGLVIAGMLNIVLSPSFILNHLGAGRFSSVIKAAFFGVPLPL